MKSGVNVFLTGEPGSGKTYTINKFVEWCDENRKHVAITASTGIAASHIGGRTIHMWSGINTRKGLSNDQIERMVNDQYVSERINSADILIVDEISMLDALFIDDLDAVCKAVRVEGGSPFGGLQVIFAGDFFQLPPVPNNDPRNPLQKLPVIYSYEAMSWKNGGFNVCYLEEQHRQSDLMYLSILGTMRKGEPLQPDQLEALKARTEVDEPQMHLFPTRREADHMNTSRLKALKGDTHTFTMKKEGLKRSQAANDFLLSKLLEQILSPEILELKEDAEVMFTRNEKDGAYVNGSLGRVITFINGKPLVRLHKNGEEILVREPAEWELEEYNVPVARAKQIPLRLAWAITVHKSQGITLDTASVDLSRCFEYGQGYVALSRVRSLEGLHIVAISDKAFLTNPEVVAQDKLFRAMSEEIENSPVPEETLDIFKQSKKKSVEKEIEDDQTCPMCGGTKNPDYPECYKCWQETNEDLPF